MIVKTIKGSNHAKYLEDVVHSVRKCVMHLNPTKCSFGVQTGKLLGLMMTRRGIKANSDRLQSIIVMRSLNNVNERMYFISKVFRGIMEHY